MRFLLFSWKKKKDPEKAPPIGLKILTDPQNPIVDIVFVHGLNGHWEDTWRHPSESVPWPQAFLPVSVPNARIMTYGYDSKVVDWSSFLGKVSVYGVQQHSHTLLETLASHRQGQEATERAIIFVCHSLGGIVCKDALIRSQKWATEEHIEPICRATRGIIFLGTPHGGAQIAKYFKILASVVGLVKQTNRTNLRDLSKGSSKLESIQEDFDHHLRSRRLYNLPPVDVKCFYEAKPITGIGIVVDHDSAVLPDNIPIAINEDHRGMTRFRSTEDSGYKLIAYHISRIVAKLRPSINQPFGLGTVENMAHETSPQPTSLPTYHEALDIPFRDAATPLSRESISSGSSSGSSFVKIPPGGRFILNQTIVPLPFDFLPPVLRNRQRTIFQSREDELRQIDAALYPDSLQMGHLGNQTHKTCTITGLGGVGKTELAYRYLTRSRDKGDFDASFFIAADTASRLREQYSQLAINLGLVSEIDQKDAETSAEIFRMWLAEPVQGIPDADRPHSTVRWLLIFDNAINTDTLQQYIPHGTSGKIIITSRNPLFTSNQFQVSGSIRLERLPSADAVKLLRYYADETKEDLQSTQDATQMVEWVEGLPMAVKQLGSMIRREHLTISLFRQTWRTKAELLRRLRNERDDEDNLITIWAIDSLYKDHRASFELLGILSLLDPELISHDLMISALRNTEYKGLLADEASYIASRQRLVDTSLIEISRETNDLRVHRLVQALMREVIMQGGQAADYLSMATRCIASAWPFLNRSYITGSAGKVERWVLCQPLLPHINHLIDVYEEWAKVDPGVLTTMVLPELLLEAVQYCNERSACREALSLLALADRLYTDMTLKSTLSTRYDVQGSVIRARIGIAVISREGDEVLDLALQVFEMEKYRHRPPKEPSSILAVAYNDLATGWAFHQDWAQAIQLLKDSMRIREGLPGFTRDKLFSPLYHLGIVYHHQGNFDAAETSLKQAIDDRSAAFGPKDKRSVRSAALYYALGNMRLSRADRRRGDLLKALNDFEVAVDIATACMGARNRTTLLCQYRKARALVSLQDNETACQLLSEVLTGLLDDPIYERDTARMSFLFAHCLEVQGNYEEALFHGLRAA
ncbi:hypothetical protein F5B17DRAFT_110946 [Nemania serpens]|nr:hypothetical protein F5B17DRAFT_110946 [Nemania serpens]